MFMLCLAIILHVHCIHLARGMMRMRTPSYVRMPSPAYVVCFARMGILLTLWSASCTCHGPELTYYDALAS